MTAGASACILSECNAGYGDCNASSADGCETNLTNNIMNCGACGRACTAGVGATARFSLAMGADDAVSARIDLIEPQLDEKTRTELEAAAFRRLVAHLRNRTDVQNIDLMNLAGFCRNCLSRWYREEAGKKGIEIADPKAREIVYGMPYEEWKARYQKEASGDQKKAFEKSHKH